MAQPIVPQDATLDNVPASMLGEPTDSLRNLFAGALNAVMQQEIASLINAGAYERSDGRQDYRNGTRPRRLDTRMGTLDLEIPRLRDGAYRGPRKIHAQIAA